MTDFRKSPLGRIVRTYVEQTFDDAAAAFRSVPSASNWGELERAMFAMQGVSSTFTMDRVSHDLATKPVPQWLELIVNAHKAH